jgi:hypothetical protein
LAVTAADLSVKTSTKSENAMDSFREEAARYQFIGTHEDLVAF